MVSHFFKALIIFFWPDQTIKLWNLHDGSLLNTLTGHKALVFCVKLNVKLNLLVSGSNDNTIKLWDIKQGTCLATLTGHKGPICSMTWSKECLFTGSTSGEIIEWFLFTYFAHFLRNFLGQEKNPSPYPTHSYFPPTAYWTILFASAGALHLLWKLGKS